MTSRVLLAILLCTALQTLSAQKKWWLQEPVRLLQTNLPLHMVPDYGPEQLLNQVVASGANTWLFNVGGIYAYYPTELKYHAVNPFMNPKRDFVGELFRLAKEKNIRVIGRFDFSRFHEDIAKENPAWCFRRSSGEAIKFNELVTACVFGDYYQEYMFKILDEAMSKYKLDGILINWWGNHSTNGYTKIPNGVCHCESCQASWKAYSDKPFPEDFTTEYYTWHNQTKSDLVSKVQEVVKKYGNETAVIMHHQTGDWTKGEAFTTETRTGDESNDWWLYQSSCYVGEYRNSYPDRGLFNTVVNFIDYNFRFAPHRKQVLENRMLQSMSHGAFPGFYMIGMPDQMDFSGADALSFPFKIHQNNEELYVGQESAAKVLVIDDGLSDAMKGIINLLSEDHIPYKIIQSKKLSDHLEGTELIFTTGATSQALITAVQNGKNLISVGNQPPLIFEEDLVIQHTVEEMKKSYWSVQDEHIFPELSKQRIIFNPSAYTEVKSNSKPSIVLIPPSRSAPPELVGTNMQISNKAGIHIRAHGQGKVAYIPWNASEVYFQHATTSIATLFRELIEHLEVPLQITTNAHSLVETSWMKKGDKRFLHLINHTGQLHGSRNKTIPFQAVSIQVEGSFKSAKATVVGTDLETSMENGKTSIRLDTLERYEMIVFE